MSSFFDNQSRQTGTMLLNATWWREALTAIRALMASLVLKTADLRPLFLEGEGGSGGRGGVRVNNKDWEGDELRCGDNNKDGVEKGGGDGDGKRAAKEEPCGDRGGGDRGGGGRYVKGGVDGQDKGGLDEDADAGKGIAV